MIEANVATRGRDGRLRDRFFNRVMFPISDIQGDCIAFGGRVIGKGEPKYLNSQETPIFHKSQVLYGLDKAKAAMASTGDAVVVEGYTDVIALHEGGIENVVATLGTALTLRHIRILSRHASKRIVYLFDGDAAGQRAADRALQFVDDSMTPEAGKSRIEVCAVTLPDNLDPASSSPPEAPMLFAGFLTKRCRFCSTASSAGSPPTASIRPKVARARLPTRCRLLRSRNRFWRKITRFRSQDAFALVSRTSSTSWRSSRRLRKTHGPLKTRRPPPWGSSFGVRPAWISRGGRASLRRSLRRFARRRAQPLAVRARFSQRTGAQSASRARAR